LALARRRGAPLRSRLGGNPARSQEPQARQWLARFFGRLFCKAFEFVLRECDISSHAGIRAILWQELATDDDVRRPSVWIGASGFAIRFAILQGRRRCLDGPSIRQAGTELTATNGWRTEAHLKSILTSTVTAQMLSQVGDRQRCLCRCRHGTQFFWDRVKQVRELFLWAIYLAGNVDSEMVRTYFDRAGPDIVKVGIGGTLAHRNDGVAIPIICYFGVCRCGTA